ncbi:flavin-containing monooxygenase [Halococcus saccharolyticus]|uniref:FAD dependent oxidoreductase n=1 Tax=Halococcus saccharolyticus DSM 5350 TaxID=1227455 RepID=M0MMU1_9EURY|nr:NAD(P)/FAD-dependent oxidoreductase [Halococcus saccharolyticus]EMA46693.1 FAD dependent oxidoreductase [Halococcus saccharolyticus DSM 5350]
MTRHRDVVVIGGGQAGLATSYYLSEAGCDHLVLERDRVGERWRSEKWDSFTLVTPNWTNGLPGFPYEGDDPDGFLSREDVIAYLEAYVDRFDPPLQCGVEVMAVQRNDSGFTVETTDATYEAANVVVATGTFQQPRTPAFSADVPSFVRQVHTSRYGNPEQLPSGGVLVVGSGQSGAQIATELHESGRDVYLSVSGAPKAPRRYRGKDVVGWMVDMGGFDAPVDSLDSPADRFAPSVYVSGKDGGREIDLLDLAADGMMLLGRTEGIEGGRLVFANDLEENLHNAYRFYAGLIGQIDEHIEAGDIDAPEPEFVPPIPDDISVDSPRELDLETANVRTVIWATGYEFDFSWVEPATFDEYGYPVHDRGVTEVAGLYFVGLQWLHTQGSSLLFGVGDDAKHITEHVLSRLDRSSPGI